MAKKLSLFTLLLFIGCLWSVNGQTKVNWLDFPALEKAMEDQPRLVLIDFYTDWCGWCKRMDQTTFKDERVIKALDTYFHVVKFDAEHKGPITFQRTSFEYVPYGRRGFHQLALGFMQDKMTFPTLVVLDSQYRIMQPIQGFQSAEDLLPMLEFLGSGKYKDQQWEDFIKTWRAKNP